MRKFLAVVKHEYKKIVLKWSFLIGTLLFPLLAAGFAIVPAIIFSIKGEPMRIAVVDSAGKIAPRLKENLSAEKMRERADQALKDSLTNITPNQEEKMKRDMAQFQDSFNFVEFNFAGKTAEQIRAELVENVQNNKLDAYLIIPSNYGDETAKYEFFSRKSGDFIINQTLRDALDNSVRSQRLADANISEVQLKNLSRKVNWEVKKIDEKGAEKDDAGGFWAGFIIAFMIYLNLAIYGQVIMSAVVEEKETRIAEILFSSAKPFELLMGKLVGVALGGLTQFAIWVTSAAIVIGLVVPIISASGFDVPIPAISLLTIVYFMIYFLLGFFLYASIFALIGSMVTTVQEGGQFAFFPIMLMLSGFYFSFAAVRDPNSALSFWSSILPFVAPMTMPVRIMTEMPPFWQILLSIALNSLTIAALVWLASRVYRVGMLMYGKRATIPEVWKWIRQS
ncbi:MAG TPA: ABC transporter permease [Pyrinomonadaceae bacterium]|nr:ABC transporter permease [Pyrinomonadaceae bacterium]